MIPQLSLIGINSEYVLRYKNKLKTELLNKSKAVIQVTKDTEGGFSRVNFKDLREKEPNDFDFCHDSNGNLKLY